MPYADEHMVVIISNKLEFFELFLLPSTCVYMLLRSMLYLGSTITWTLDWNIIFPLQSVKRHI